MNQNILEGVAVVLIQDGKLLLTLRKVGDNIGTYELPAGHIEAGESTMETAKREVLEETGLVIDELKSMAIFGNTELFSASIAGGVLANLEPHAHESVEWYSLKNLPIPLGPSAMYFKNIYMDKFL